MADGAVIAEHARRSGRDVLVCDPWHYVPVLELKPGALRNGVPFRNWDLPVAIQTVRDRILIHSCADASDGAKARADLSPIVEVADAPPPEVFRILVVEDSFLLGMAIESVIDDLGWVTVGPATRKSEALALAGSEVFDAALLDVNLDGETFWDVAAVLRARGIRFVFSTGYDPSSVLPDDLTGSAVLAKPYQNRDLENRLREVIAAGGRRSTATPPA